MLNFPIQDHSMVASSDGANRINRIISEMIKDEIVAHLEKSGRQVVLDLKGVGSNNSPGFSALQALAELARNSKRFFAMAEGSQDAIVPFFLLNLDQPVRLSRN